VCVCVCVCVCVASNLHVGREMQGATSRINRRRVKNIQSLYEIKLLTFPAKRDPSSFTSSARAPRHLRTHAHMRITMRSDTV